MKKELILIFLILPLIGMAQTDRVFRDSISSMFDRMLKAEDSQKVLIASKAEELLFAYYSKPEHFDHELDSMPFLGQLSSWDGVVKMLCWNLAFANGELQYHCVMRHRTPSKSVVVTVFQDAGSDWKRLERRTVTPKDWYGALYYKLLANRYRGETIYTVIGWDGNDRITNRKLVDIINIQGNSVTLGSAVFKDEKERPVFRLIYEYANDASMALNFEEKDKLIVMDHLAPEDSRFEGQRQFYGPDFSYDALEFSKGEWVFKRDVFAKNRGLNNLPDSSRPGDFKD